MRIPFVSMFMTSPFSGLEEHAEKVKECAWIFQHAIECLLVQNFDSLEEVRRKVAEARKYFSSYSENQRMVVKRIVRTLREQERLADEAEDHLKLRIFQIETDPITVFHMVRLAEIVGSIADHAQNAGDMMRAMIAR